MIIMKSGHKRAEDGGWRMEDGGERASAEEENTESRSGMIIG